MKIFYICDNCGLPIDAIEVNEIDEVKFGFDCLTDAERAEMIRVDAANNVMYVQSLCDACIVSLGLGSEEPVKPTKYLH